jgi:tRNA(Arg) A34 adenosine deaminase TadA
MLCSCDPCLMCAKMIHHAGIERLYAPLLGGEHAEGLEYLRSNHVELCQLSPITDSNEY